MSAQSLLSDSDSMDGQVPETGARGNSPTSGPPARVNTVSLYRKYRPQSFAAQELVGQGHVIRTLRNAILLDRVGHAYLFSGPRGTGKTTTARLLAKAVNCLAGDLSHRPCNECRNCVAINANATPDIVEIDAASNRGIDDIRDLRDRVRYAPAQLPSKVYIIDEAHQITGAAANAFLKTLEEPPAHSRFILATTDPEELLPTIVSRCQRFEFRRLSADDMVHRLRVVASEEEVAVADDALRVIARHATGSMRDALGLLEQSALLATGSSGTAQIEASDVRAVLGLSQNERVEQIVAALAERNAGDALGVVQAAVDAGEDPRQLNRQLLSYLRMLLIERSGGGSDADDHARALAAQFQLGELAALARRFGEIDFSIKHAPFPQLPLEIALVEAAAIAPGDPTADRIAGSQDDASSPSPPPRSLRDRVRAPSPAQPQSPPAANPAPTARITPLRPSPPAPQIQPAPPARNDTIAIDVEQIADLWPRVRADVKALNRRIEALLSEVDPVAIAGNQITLAVPYPFHRDKLNSDEVREIVAGVLSRLLERDISLQCILRGEVAGPPPRAAVHPGAPATEEVSESPVDSDDEDRDLARLQAAKNIFDAEEIDADEIEKLRSVSDEP
jgi:DNA polymerase-3 subunit gamma/tau